MRENTVYSLRENRPRPSRPIRKTAAQDVIAMNPHTPQSADIPALVQGELTLIGGLNERLFRLLAAIAATGSITKAAREVGMSYKGAWELIERANNLSPELLVDSATGGRAGGGTQLTTAGQELLNLFIRLQEEHRAFLERLNRELAANPNLQFLHKRFNMKASARNQLFGSVKEVVPGTVNSEVIISLKGGDELVAAVTHKSVETLEIAAGKEVVALVKAPHIIVVKDFGGYRLSARNQLSGAVERVLKGAVNAEVVIKLAGGDAIAATITNESVDTLGLQEGETATAVFKAGAVIVGVAEK